MADSNTKERFSKPRAEKYEPKLAINGTFEQAVQALFINADKPKQNTKKKGA